MQYCLVIKSQKSDAFEFKSLPYSEWPHLKLFQLNYLNCNYYFNFLLIKGNNDRICLVVCVCVCLRVKWNKVGKGINIVQGTEGALSKLWVILLLLLLFLLVNAHFVSTLWYRGFCDLMGKEYRLWSWTTCSKELLNLWVPPFSQV